MDAERIELDADAVDGVLCRFGYMLMPDPAAALAETRRVLRQGGRLALAVWGAPERNPWITIGFGLLVEHGHLLPPDPGDPGPFAMADEAGTRALLADAGFPSVRTEEIPVRFAFRDLDDYTTFSTDTGGPAALALRGLPERRARGPQGAAPCRVRPVREPAVATSFRAWRSPRSRAELADVDEDSLDDVVADALVVPRWSQRLHLAGGFGRPAGEFVLARGGGPVERPAAPCEALHDRGAQRQQLGVGHRWIVTGSENRGANSDTTPIRAPGRQ